MNMDQPNPRVGGRNKNKNKNWHIPQRIIFASSELTNLSKNSDIVQSSCPLDKVYYYNPYTLSGTSLHKALS